MTHRLCPERSFLCATSLITPDRTYLLQQRQQNVTEVSANLRTQNEGRAELGLPPVEGGDRFLYQLSPVGVASAANVLGPKLATVATAATKSGTKAYQSTFPDPRPLADKLGEILNRIAADSVSKLKAVGVGSVTTKAFIPLSGWTEQMARELTPVLRSYYDEGAGGVFAEIGGSPDLRRLAVPKLDDAVNDAALQLARSTLETTELAVDEAVNRLRQQIGEGLGLGEANAALTERVQAIFTSLTTERAYMIAETESSRAKHGGELIAIDEAGVTTKKIWLADNMACDFCKQLDGKAVDLNDVFTVVGTGPYSRIEHPPGHPRCRCTLQYDFED
jgi:hypothetical protein